MQTINSLKNEIKDQNKIIMAHAKPQAVSHQMMRFLLSPKKQHPMANRTDIVTLRVKQWWRRNHAFN